MPEGSITPWDRINYFSSMTELIDFVVSEYNLGKIIDFSIIHKGLIEVNIFAETFNNKYVIKIFSNKSKQRVSEILKAQQKLYSLGLQTPKILLTHKDKQYFAVYSKSGNPYYGCLIEYFDGDDFSIQEPTDNDLKQITQQLALIHKTDMKVNTFYDDGLPLNLPSQLSTYRALIPSRYRDYIYEISEQVRNIDKNKLRKSLIHGDLSREHVIKNRNGELCILDFGGVNFESSIADLSFMVSYFCLDMKAFSESEYLRRYQIIMNEYKKRITITQYEESIIPLIIKANYALCYLFGTYYHESKRDPLASYLINFGINGLEYSQKCNFTSTD